MKKLLFVIITLLFVLTVMLTACSGTSESLTPAPTPVGTGKPTATANPNMSDEPASTLESTQEPTPTPTPEPTPEPGPANVSLVNSPDSTGNTHYAASHYGLHITYGNELVTVMNYMIMFRHGADHAKVPDKVEEFEFQAEDLQYFNGLLYFLNYDFNNGVYYMYSYDFENPPVKIGDTTVYHYEFINGTIYFTKEFVQGPIYSMNPDGSGETQVTTMRAHSFVHEGSNIYFYATDAGTAPGLVQYNLATNEESTIVFPFYSHNYLVHGGYVYYSLDSGSYRSIHRMSISDQNVEDIWLEMTDFTISLNISDGDLYLLVGDSVYKSALDGGNRVKVLQADEGLQTGLYIFGNRIYCADYSFIYCSTTDGSELSLFSFNILQ